MTDQFGQLEEFSRDRLPHLLRKWLPAVALAAVVAAVSALLASRLIAPTYLAEAQLYLAPASNPTVVLQDVVLGQNLARSYVQLADADVVLEAAMRSVGLTDLKSFRDKSQVSQVRDTSIITVAFRHTDPETAAAAANAIAQTFITQSRALQSNLQGTTTTQLEDQIRGVGDDIKSLDAEIAALRNEIAATPKPGSSPVVSKSEQQTQLQQLDLSRQSKQQTLAQLLKTRDDMRLANARAENTVTLWQPATAPEVPESPKPVLNAAIAALVAAFVTAVVLAVLAYLDDRITEPDEVRARLGVVPLGQVQLGQHPETIGGKLFVRDDPKSSPAEAFRALRTNILFSNVDKRPQTILVTSALPREGKSVVSANVALAFAEAGTPTILVDADLRRPSQHRLFRVRPSVGLTSLLADSSNAISLDQFDVATHLRVIPSGPLPPNPAELLSSSRMSALLAYLGRSMPGGVIVIDTSPILAVTDAVALATKVDGTLVVIDSARTHARASRQAVEALRRVHATILGALLNKVQFGESSYYYYGAYYGGNKRELIPGGTSAVSSRQR